MNKKITPRISLGFFIGKNNFADMKKNVSLLSQTKTFSINPENLFLNTSLGK